MAQLQSPAAHTIMDPAGARWIAMCSIKLSPAGHATGYAGPATRGIGPVRSAELITGIRVVISVMCSGATTGSSPVAGSAEASSDRPPRPG